MSNEQPPVRKVIPYKSGKRPSTFRRLKIDFAGTALEVALNEQEHQRQQEQPVTETIAVDDSSGTTIHQSPPLPNSSQPVKINQSEIRTIIEEFPKKNTDSSLQAVSHLQFQKGESPPVTTTPHQDSQETSLFIAPARDFNRRANSLDRDALPSGLFPGSTKKVYDALYLRTRGAVIPVKAVQASRRDLLSWTGIRNLKTIDNHIRYLMTAGLIVRHWELGSNEGSSYEVCLPEELVRHHSPPLVVSGGESPPLTTTPQKTSSGYTQKLGSGGECQTIDNTATLGDYKTYKTFDDDDTHTLEEFLREIVEAARDVLGGKLVKTEQERERWKALGKLIADELRETAERTDTISSVPAFFTAHLRRRLARRPSPTEETEKRPELKPREQRASVAEIKLSSAKGNTESSDRATTSTGKSGFTLEQCRLYADHLHTTGQGINNPGGFAMAIHRSGMADPLIAKFLHPSVDQPALDVGKCPDCKGSNFYYPDGLEKGVVKCKHERLTGKADSHSAGSVQTQSLTAAEIKEQAGIIAELIEGGYTIEQAATQFGAGLRREDWQKISSIILAQNNTS